MLLFCDQAVLSLLVHVYFLDGQAGLLQVVIACGFQACHDLAFFFVFLCYVSVLLAIDVVLAVAP